MKKLEGKFRHSWIQELKQYFLKKILCMSVGLGVEMDLYWAKGENINTYWAKTTKSTYSNLNVLIFIRFSC